MSAVVGMDSGGCENVPRVFASDPHPLLASCYAGARNHHSPHSSGKSPLNDFIPVCMEGSVRQVDPDIHDFCNWLRGAHVARAAHEAFAAMARVSLKAVNNCWDPRSSSRWSPPSNPMSFHDPIPPTPQADCAASS